MNKFIAAVIVAFVAAGGAYLIASSGSDSVPESDAKKVEFDSYKEADQTAKNAPADEPSDSETPKQPTEAPTEVKVVHVESDEKEKKPEPKADEAKPGDGSSTFSKPTVDPEHLKALRESENLKIREINVQDNKLNNLEIRSIERDQNGAQQNN